MSSETLCTAKCFHKHLQMAFGSGKVCMSSRQIFSHVAAGVAAGRGRGEEQGAHLDHILFDDNLFERTLAGQPQQQRLQLSFVSLLRYNGAYTLYILWVTHS